jgi:hypothetical protein
LNRQQRASLELRGGWTHMAHQEPAGGALQRLAKSGKLHVGNDAPPALDAAQVVHRRVPLPVRDPRQALAEHRLAKFQFFAASADPDATEVLAFVGGSEASEATGHSFALSRLGEWQTLPT